LIIATATLNGCALFGNSDKYDVVSAAGTITISDPKLYSHEALISERFLIVAFGFDDFTGVRFFVDLNLARFAAGRPGSSARIRSQAI
jgi:hypothetical protein